MEYVIVGNGVAGVTAAMTLRARDASANITLISGESDYFFSRTALMYAFMDTLTLRDTEPYERGVYEKQRITRIRDVVTDLDASQRTVTLRSGRELRFDRLLLATGSVPRKATWQDCEHVKDGLVHFVSLEDLAACERLTCKGGKAVVVGGGLIGVELVECLRHHGMQVTFLVREPWYWPAALAREEAELVTQHLVRHGVDVRVGEEVGSVRTDIDGRANGIWTKSGGLLECELLGVAIGVQPAVAWLTSCASVPELNLGVVVGPGFRTSLENVWAAGDCAEVRAGDGESFVEQIWYSAKRQGELAARSMMGEHVRYERPIFYNSAKFFEIEYTTVGAVAPDGERVRSFFYRWPGREACARIVERDGAVCGVNMLGARWDHTLFERWIKQRRSMDELISALHHAQFDVEFGRTPLDPMRAAFHEWRTAAVR